jgi:ketosteroid isomerase-like protein
MSGENVKSSREAWDRFLADDMDGLLALLDPEVEVHDPPDLPGATVHHGHEGYLTQIDNFREAFREVSYEPLEFIDFGEQVVVVIRAVGVGTGSGVEGEMIYAQLETWRTGKAVRVQYFLSRDAALEAAGLSD